MEPEDSLMSTMSSFRQLMLLSWCYMYCVRLHQLGGGGTRRLGSGLHTLRPGLYCIRLHQLGGGGTRRLGSGLHTLRPGLYCIRLHQLGGGGTRRLGSGLHTLRPGLYCIRLHQLGGEEAPGDWAVVSVLFAKVCNLEKKLLWRTPLSFETEGCLWTAKSCSTGQHFSALRLIVRCADITSHHSDGHLHCTVTGRPSNNALWTRSSRNEGPLIWQ